MSKRLAAHALLILSALLASNAIAAVPLKTLGFDDMSCAAWVASRQDAESRGQFIAWIRGFLTGHNYANQKQQVSEISGGTVENFIDRYCVQDPKGQFQDAAMRLADRFSGRNEAITK